MLQFGYISDRIVVGDLLDDADHDLFRKVCHSHHSLNHLLPPERIFTTSTRWPSFTVTRVHYIVALKVIYCESLI